MGMDYHLCILPGLRAGRLSGTIGIGGGTVVVPALVLIFGYSHYSAQGTTMALLVLPNGRLAVLHTTGRDTSVSQLQACRTWLWREYSVLRSLLSRSK